MEKLLESLDTLKGKQKENIENNAEQILFSKKLVTIETAVPVELNEDELKRKNPDNEKLRALFDELEFRSLAARLGSGEAGTNAGSKGSATTVSSQSEGDFTQGSLFGESTRCGK